MRHKYKSSHSLLLQAHLMALKEAHSHLVRCKPGYEPWIIKYRAKAQRVLECGAAYSS